MSRRLRPLLGVAAVAFAVLFTIAASAQYFYLDFQLKRAIAAQLQSWINELRNEVTSGGHWDILGYRRSSPEAPAFYIVDADGTIVDLEASYRECCSM
jgi:hypothetical protein